MTERRSKVRDEIDRPLPHNLEAERAILGAVLLHGDVFDQVVDTIEGGDFFRDAHRRIFQAMDRLHEARSAIDFVTLREELSRIGDLDEIGGPAYLAALTDGLPRHANIGQYAEIIREKSQLRRAILAGNKLLMQAYDGESRAAEVVEDAADRLHEISAESLPGKPIFLRQMMADGIAHLEHAYAKRGAVVGLETGFRELDLMTAGLHAGDLIYIAARTSMGKTALAMNIARRIGMAQTVLVFSLEMTRLQLFIRLLAAESGVDSHIMRTGYLREPDWHKLSQAMVSLDTAHVLIDDTPGIGLREIRGRSRQVRAENGLHLVVIDYVQLMKGRGKYESRTQEVGTISHGLKAIAKELNVPVIALSQLSRAPEGGPGRKARRPVLSDLRESGDLEQDADVVLFIYQPEPDDDLVELIIAKQRNGPTGTVKLLFDKATLQFSTWQEPSAGPAQPSLES